MTERKQVFISYSTDAEAECLALAELLQPAYRCWYMKQDRRSDWKVRSEWVVKHEISAFILILSPGALLEEGYVETEVEWVKDRIKKGSEPPVTRFYLKVGVTMEQLEGTWASGTVRQWVSWDFDLSDEGVKKDVAREVARAFQPVTADADPSTPKEPDLGKDEAEPVARPLPPAGGASSSLIAETITAALERGPLAYDDVMLAVVEQLNGVGAKSIEVEIRRLCADGVLRMSDDSFAAKPSIWLR